MTLTTFRLIVGLF